MLPNPLHPAVVQFPLMLAFLFPLFAASAFLAIRRGAASAYTTSVGAVSTAHTHGNEDEQ